MNERGYKNCGGLSDADIKEILLRERAKTIFQILSQCHIIMDELICGEFSSPKEVASIPTGKVLELQEQLRAIEIYAGELSARLRRLTEKI